MVLGKWLSAVSVVSCGVVASACGAPIDGSPSDSSVNPSGDGVTLNGAGDIELATVEQNLSVSALVTQVRSRIAANEVTPLAPIPEISGPLYSLGQALAFDKILSGNQDISCLTCHHPTQGTGDNRSLPLGSGGVGLGQARTGGHIIPRNAPPLFNLHTFPSMFLDSRVEMTDTGLKTPAGNQLPDDAVDAFEFGVVSAQAMFPVTSREEMRGQVGENDVANLGNTQFREMWELLMGRLRGIEEYRDMFSAAYGAPADAIDTMSFAYAANAIAAFEIKAFAATNSPWQQFLLGNDGALSKKQLEGAVEFFDGGCYECHSGSTLSDFSHRDTGLVQFGPGKGHGSNGLDDFGREGVTHNEADRYAFRVPPLFNIELTAPYGHDGQYVDLTEMVKHYNNADLALQNYKMNKNVIESALFPLEQNTRTEIATYMDTAMFDVTANHVKILQFLSALTDPASLNLSSVIPGSVPSGLDVAD